MRGDRLGVRSAGHSRPPASVVGHHPAQRGKSAAEIVLRGAGVPDVEACAERPERFRRVVQRHRISHHHGHPACRASA